jgi:hypothetical protein
MGWTGSDSTLQKNIWCYLTDKITIKLNKKDIKAIYKAHKYLCDIKSDLLENELGKIIFQYEKIHNRS